MDINSAGGRDAGITEEKLRALEQEDPSDRLSEEEWAAVALADAMAGAPARVPEALFTHLRRLFNEEQLVELASAIAWENHRARFNRVFDVEAEGYSDGAYCPLPDR